MSSAFDLLRGGDGAGELEAEPGAGRVVRGEVEGLADGAAWFASGKRERRHDEVRRAGGDDGVRDGERRAAADARVAQREIRVADVHDGEGVRHRRRGWPFANSKRQRLLSSELHCGADRFTAVFYRNTTRIVHLLLDKDGYAFICIS